jgi:hypothetical protein
MPPQEKRRRFAKQQRNNAVGEVFAAAVMSPMPEDRGVSTRPTRRAEEKGREIIPALRYPCKFKTRL